MKRNLFLCMFIFNAIAYRVEAQKVKRTGDVLEITGAALLNDNRTRNYAVSVYLDGVLIDSMYAKSKRTIKFYVDYNEVYTFLFQKVNCIDKIVIVNTEVPNGLVAMEDNTFDFQVEMSQALTKRSDDLLDYPVAVLLINKEDELLEASAEYNEFTHNNPKIMNGSNPRKRKKSN